MIARVRKLSLGSGEYERLQLWCPACDDLHEVGIRANRIGPNWQWDGNLDAPTISPSILVDFGPLGYAGTQRRCHSFVVGGQWQFLSDCTHGLAGRTVPCMPLPDWLIHQDDALDGSAS